MVLTLVSTMERTQYLFVEEGLDWPVFYLVGGMKGISALFALLISHTFSVNEQYFSLTTNQPTVFSDMAYQPSEHGTDG